MRCMLLLLMFTSTPGLAQEVSTNESATGDTVLTVGTKLAPPFVIKRPDGELAGISIDLWRAIAAAGGWQYRFVEADLPRLVEGTASGEFDLSVAALTATAEREQRVDFAHPFYSTGLAIAAPEGSRNIVLVLLDSLLSAEFFGAVSALVLLLLAVGVLVWLAERRRNPDMFGGSNASGIGSGFWWAAVTMTTVGYGDKAPITPLGRIVGFVWMFAAIIVISGFTAAIATSLTLGQLDGEVRGPQDLGNVTVAAVPDSTSASYLSERRVRFQSYDTVEAAMQALAADQVEAVVHDAPILRYLANTEHQGIVRVLPGTFERQDYAMALPPGSSRREELNRLLLEQLASPAWNEIRFRYLAE